MKGSRIKEAIEASGFTAEQIAVEAEMSISNLQKIYKRDSVESKYLVRICKKLIIPYSALLGPEEWLGGSVSNSGQMQVAHQVVKNKQHINTGGGDEVTALRYQLELCQVERANLEQRLKDKEELIEVLRGR